MMTFQTSLPEECGIVETDEAGIVTGFHEKVVKPPGTCANGAVYLVESELLDWLAVDFIENQPLKEFALAMFNLNSFLYVN